MQEASEQDSTVAARTVAVEANNVAYSKCSSRNVCSLYKFANLNLIYTKNMVKNLHIIIPYIENRHGLHPGQVQDVVLFRVALASDRMPGLPQTTQNNQGTIVQQQVEMEVVGEVEIELGQLLLHSIVVSNISKSQQTYEWIKCVYVYKQACVSVCVYMLSEWVCAYLPPNISTFYPSKMFHFSKNDFSK